MKIKLIASTAPEEFDNHISFFVEVDDFIYLLSKNLDNGEIGGSFLKPAKSIDEEMDAWCLKMEDLPGLSEQNLVNLTDEDKQKILSYVLRNKEKRQMGIEEYNSMSNSIDYQEQPL